MKLFQKIPLNNLQGAYFEPTKTRGAIRLLKCHEDVSISRGLYFVCPVCTKDEAHGVICWFNHPDIDPTLKPTGRWTVAMGPDCSMPPPLKNLTLHEPVYMQGVRNNCAWSGRITNGEVLWED